MAKTIFAFIAACAVTIFAVGCSGSQTDNDRIVARIQSLLNDANSENISSTMSNYSFDYCDDVDFCGGGDYQDERNCWIDTFTDPTTSVRFSNLRVIDVEVNQAQTEGYIDAIVHFTVFDEFGGFIAEDDYSFRMFMIKEGTRWVMWGDGNCVDSPLKGLLKWKDKVGKATKTGTPETRKR
ncbi:MAG: hypothetical protein ABIV13_01125 [Fimbriimonadales bacterium]